MKLRSETIYRRKVLELAGTVGIAGLAGCSGGDGESTATSDSTGHQDSSSTTKERTSSETKNPDQHPPTINEAVLETPDEAGVLRYRFEGEDDIGIEQIFIQSKTETKRAEFEGETSFESEGQIQGQKASETSVTFGVSDTGGNTETITKQGYVRKYPVPRSQNLDIGTTYRVYAEHEKACRSASPEIGNYDGPTESMVNRHVDQLQGAGASRILVRINDIPDIEAVESFVQAPLGDQIQIEFRWGLLDWFREDVALPDQVEKMAAAIESLENYATRDGRPIVSLRQTHVISPLEDRAPELWSHIDSTYGSPSGLIESIRSAFSVDGMDPYLVGETPIHRGSLVGPMMERTEYPRKLLSQLDALRNTFGLPFHRSGDVEAQTVSEYILDIQDGSLFANRQGLEFEPTVVPGYLNGRVSCSPTEILQRDSERFRELLAYAGYYSTSGRVVVDSFNDWIRGTQIEAGQFGEVNYGDTYISATRDVAQQDTLVTHTERTEYHVSPDGSDINPGSPASPLKTIQEGVMRAGPGDTVHVNPGEYSEKIRTVRDGTEDNPITITGPEDATIRAPDGLSVWIKNSHIRFRGLTIDGLLDPDHPDQVDSYSDLVLLLCRPPDNVDEYLENIVVSPDGIGNSGHALMVFNRTKGLEIGPTRVIGLGGANYVIGDETSHVGEIVYIGSPPSQIEKERYPWDEIDQTRDVHVHHIDNSEGHPHSELVNTKIGTRDVQVEYCTSAGGSQNTETYPSADVRFQSVNATLRWCDLQDGQGHGVQIIGHDSWLSERESPPISPEEAGTGHEIYGNIIKGYGQKALDIDSYVNDEQILCGNDITGETDGEPEKTCDSNLPEGEGIGHTGGDSPWS